MFIFLLKPINLVSAAGGVLNKRKGDKKGLGETLLGSCSSQEYECSYDSNYYYCNDPAIEV